MLIQSVNPFAKISASPEAALLGIAAFTQGASNRPKALLIQHQRDLL